MEEKAHLPPGYFDKLLVDQPVANPFESQSPADEVQYYPYENSSSKGYLRYVILGKQMIILDCLVVQRKG